MKKLLSSILLLVFTPALLFATVYETCNSGTWGNNSGSTTLRLSTDGGATCTINPYSVTWGTDDELIFKAGATVTIGANVSITPKVKVTINGNVIFSNGKLNLGNAASTLILNTGSTLTCSSGCGNNDQITVGSFQYKANDLNVINNAPRPTTVDNSGSVLPIKLIYFVASVVNGRVFLEWATSMQENFEKFVVERSNTGKDFESVGQVLGTGSNIYEIETSYNFEDESPILGFNYYRLKAVDLDGQFEYFGIKAIKLSGQKQLSFFPNPSTGKSISFSLNFNPSEGDQASLVNSLGIEVLRVPVLNIKNQLDFDRELAPGVYVLKYRSRDFETTTRLVVTH